MNVESRQGTTQRIGEKSLWLFFKCLVFLVTPTDHPKLLCNRCVIEVLGIFFFVLSLCFLMTNDILNSNFLRHFVSTDKLRPVHTRDPINPRSPPLWKNGRIGNERALIGESVRWSKIQRGLVGPALRGRGERDKFFMQLKNGRG